MKMGELFNHIRVALGGPALSGAAMTLVCDDLDNLPRDKVLSSLGRCLIECRGTLFLCDVYSRLEDSEKYIARPYYEDKDFIEFVATGSRHS